MALCGRVAWECHRPPGRRPIGDAVALGTAFLAAEFALARRARRVDAGSGAEKARTRCRDHARIRRDGPSWRAARPFLLFLAAYLTCKTARVLWLDAWPVWPAAALAVTLFLLWVAIVLAKGRPGPFLGCLCLIGLGCVVALSSVLGLIRGQVTRLVA